MRQPHTHRIQRTGIFTYIDHKDKPFMSVNISVPWIRHGVCFREAICFDTKLYENIIPPLELRVDVYTNVDMDSVMRHVIGSRNPRRWNLMLKGKSQKIRGPVTWALIPSKKWGVPCPQKLWRKSSQKRLKVPFQKEISGEPTWTNYWFSGGCFLVFRGSMCNSSDLFK